MTSASIKMWRTFKASNYSHMPLHSGVVYKTCGGRPQNKKNVQTQKWSSDDLKESTGILRVSSGTLIKTPDKEEGITETSKVTSKTIEMGWIQSPLERSSLLPDNSLLNK